MKPMKSGKRHRRRSRQWRPSLPPLRLTPYAWAKLLFLRDVGGTEVGGFGVSAPADLLLVEDVRLVRQQCSPVTVKFDDSSVADFFDTQVDQGRTPEQFGRIWIHTHPGNSPYPSGTDEQTFDRCFGNSDWAVMFILALGGQTYARLRFHAGPRGDLELPVEIDFQQPFSAADPSAWAAEYEAAVSLEPQTVAGRQLLLAGARIAKCMEELAARDGEAPGDNFPFDPFLEMPDEWFAKPF